MRADLARTLNFVIPGELLEDAVRLGLELDTVTGQLQIPVRPAVTLGVRTVELYGTRVDFPRLQEVLPIFRYLRAAFPVSDVQVPFRNRWLSIPVPPEETDPAAGPLVGRLLSVGDLRDCSSILALLRSTYAGDSLPPGAPDYTVTLGLAHAGFSGCAGLAYLGAPFGISYNDPSAGAHEVGHTLGLEHASNDHGEDRGGGYEEWPYPHGHMSPDATLRNVDHGFVFGAVVRRTGPDAWTVRLVDMCPVPDFSRRSPCVLPESQHEHELMSYGEWQGWTKGFFDGTNAFKWLSDINHERIYNAIRARRSGAGAGGAATSSASRQEALIVAGMINPDGTATLLTPLLRKPMPVSLLAPEGAGGAYVLELRGAAGTLLQRSFDVDQVSAAFGAASRHFWLAVPYVEGARELVVRRGSRTLLKQTASANPPVVRVTGPNGGESFPSGSMTVTWEASDPDGDPLTFLVQYSPDGGTSWESITTVLPGQPRRVEVPVDAFMPGARAIVRVTASDGFHTAYDVSDAPFRMGVTGDAGLPPDIAGHWARDAIAELINAGVVRGYEDGTFRPNATISRQEAAVIIGRVLGLAEQADEVRRFRDGQSVGAWAAGYVGAAARAGIIGGYPDGGFRPAGPITRAETAAIIARALPALRSGS